MGLGKVGVVFGGGGFGGAYSVGHVKALAAHGVKADFVQGVSVGVMNAAKLVETNWDVAALEEKWRTVERLGASAIFRKTEILTVFFLMRSPFE